MTAAAQQWNQRDAGGGFLFGTEPNAWLREQPGRLPSGGRILCLADGPAMTQPGRQTFVDAAARHGSGSEPAAACLGRGNDGPAHGRGSRSTAPAATL